MWSYCLQEKRFLISIFLLALFVRLLLFATFLSKNENYSVYFDSAQYQTVAQSIVQGKGVADSDGTPNFYRLPGYPAFLAGCYALFDGGRFFCDYLRNNLFVKKSPSGCHPRLRPGIQEDSIVLGLDPGSRAGMTSVDKVFLQGVRLSELTQKSYDHFAMLIQIILSSLLPLFVFCLTLILFPHQFLLAKVAALVATLHLGFIIYAGMLATESLFTLFLLLFLLFLFQKYTFLAGLMLGIASLIRPVGHFLLPVALVLIFIAHEKFFLKIKRASFLMIGWLLIVIWWLGRNCLLTGMIFFHTLPGLHFLQYTTAKVIMELRNCTYVEARGALLDEWHVTIKTQEVLLNRSLSEPEKCTIAEKITFFYCKQRPLTVIKNCSCEMIKTIFGLYSAQLIFADTEEWTDYSTSNIWSKLKKYLYPSVNTRYLIPLTWFEIVCSILLLIGFFGFFIRALMSQVLLQQALQPLLFIFVLIGLTCAYGCARLRLPLEPLLVIVSLDWWVCFGQKFYLHKYPYLVDTSCK